MYMPYEVDCTLQEADSWFYSEAAGYKSIVELAGQYHDSVGHGTRNASLLRRFMPKTIVLPRQAREKYSESTQQEMRVSQVGISSSTSPRRSTRQSPTRP
jgi:hypothetical protein